MIARGAIVLATFAALVACKDESTVDPDSLPPPADLVDALERALADGAAPATRARVLVGIADAEVSAASQLAGARLTAATVATREVGLPSEQSSLRAHLVDLWCRLGQIETAQQITAEITGDELKSEAQVSLTTALVKTGHVEAAEAVARSVKVDRYRGAALLEVVRAHLAEDRRAEAGKLVAAFGSLVERDQALSEVVAAYARAKHFKTVDGAIQDIRSPHWRGAAQAAYALALFEQRDRKRALRVVGEIESDWMRVRGLMDLYLAASRKGRRKAAARHLERAQTRTADISDRLMRSSAWAEIALHLADAGELERAQAILPRIEDLNTRRKAEADLVARLADAGRFEDARRLLGAVEADALWGGVAARALARALAEAGQIDGALDAVARIRAPDLRLPTLGYVAAIQAAGDAQASESQIAVARRLLRGL